MGCCCDYVAAGTADGAVGFGTIPRYAVPKDIEGVLQKVAFAIQRLFLSFKGTAHPTVVPCNTVYKYRP